MSLKICVDFDGTVTKHEYPRVGADVDGAVRVLKRLVKADHKIILYTMRSGPTLKHAIEWYRKHGIPLYGANYSPGQESWTNSPKVYGNLYIDDAALGTPLIHVKGERPYVDWDKVEVLLEQQNIL